MGRHRPHSPASLTAEPASCTAHQGRLSEELIPFERLQLRLPLQAFLAVMLPPKVEQPENQEGGEGTETVRHYEIHRRPPLGTLQDRRHQKPAAWRCAPHGRSGEAPTCSLDEFPDGRLSAASICGRAPRSHRPGVPPRRFLFVRAAFDCGHSATGRYGGAMRYPPSFRIVWEALTAAPPRWPCRAPRQTSRDLLMSRAAWPARSELPRRGPRARRVGDSVLSSGP